MIFILLLAVLLCTGCQSLTHQTGQAERSGFLADYSQLHEGNSHQAQLLYIKPEVKWKNYNKIKIEPHQLWLASEYIEPEEKKRLQSLLNYFHAQLRKDFSDVMTVVEDANDVDNRTLILRLAVTEAEASRPLADTVSNIIPVGLAISFAKRAISGSHLSVGKASIECEILDHEGQRYFAMIDERAGRKILKGKFDAWSDVKGAFEFWSHYFASGIDRLRKADNLKVTDIKSR